MNADPETSHATLEPALLLSERAQNILECFSHLHNAFYLSRPTYPHWFDHIHNEKYTLLLGCNVVKFG
jgi:hypothetical protein